MIDIPKEYTDKINKAMEEFDKQGINSLGVLPLLFFIDIDSWKFPEDMRSMMKDDIMDLIENNNDLKEAFQSMKKQSGKEWSI